MLERLGKDKFDNIVVASGLDFPDALSASYLAYKKEAPIIITMPSLEDDIKTYIKEHLNEGGTIYLIGKGKVSNTFSEGLDKFTINDDLAHGDNRFLTNLAVLEELEVTEGEILVATGTGYADSLSASSAGKPLLLVYTSLLNEQKEWLESVKGKVSFCILGDDKAVSEAIEHELGTYGEVRRIAGNNRLETSALIAEDCFENPTEAIIAYGWDFPDGLCSGPLAAVIGAPVLMAYTGLEEVTMEYAQKVGIHDGYVTGGTDKITDASVRKILHLSDDVTIAAKQ